MLHRQSVRGGSKSEMTNDKVDRSFILILRDANTPKILVSRCSVLGYTAEEPQIHQKPFGKGEKGFR